ncbi:MAG: calcium/sodium antiporter, partial [Gammaproteobacteria bacterium]|nr:calcium/sodium antiporter [Gammaproteobacteria bacterium]
MLTSIAAILIGFALLIWGADRFVIGASATARNLGISPLIIGLTIVGFGTSAPEMLVSGIAAWSGNPGMGLGNAMGSNITNIGLVLGVTALVVPISVHSKALQREFPVLMVIMALALYLLWDLNLGFIDGLILLAGMVLMVLWMVHIGLKERSSDPMTDEFSDEIPSDMATGRALLWLLIGILTLLGSSKLLVWGAINVAQSFGVSDLVIGLTIIAIGTSLPELAATVMSALKGEHDIAVGNVLGSNMFNLLAVLGIPGVIHPADFEVVAINRDFLVMGLFTIALFVMAYGFRGQGGKINRFEGAILLGGYFGYMGLL